MLSDDDSDLDALIEGFSCSILSGSHHPARARSLPGCCSLEAMFPANAVSLTDTSMTVPVQIWVAAGQMTTTFLPPLPMDDAFHRREVGPAFPWQA